MTVSPKMSLEKIKSGKEKSRQRGKEKQEAECPAFALPLPIKQSFETNQLYSRCRSAQHSFICWGL